MQKTLLTNEDHYLHIRTWLKSPKNMEIIYMRGVKPIQPIILPDREVFPSKVDVYGNLRKYFSKSDFEEICLRLIFEQDWQAVKYIPYPIKPALPKKKSVQQNGHLTYNNVGDYTHLDHQHIWHSHSSFLPATTLENFYVGETLTEKAQTKGLTENELADLKFLLQGEEMYAGFPVGSTKLMVVDSDNQYLAEIKFQWQDISTGKVYETELLPATDFESLKKLICWRAKEFFAYVQTEAGPQHGKMKTKDFFKYLYQPGQYSKSDTEFDTEAIQCQTLCKNLKSVHGIETTIYQQADPVSQSIMMETIVGEKKFSLKRKQDPYMGLLPALQDMSHQMILMVNKAKKELKKVSDTGNV